MISEVRCGQTLKWASTRLPVVLLLLGLSEPTRAAEADGYRITAATSSEGWSARESFIVNPGEPFIDSLVVGYRSAIRPDISVSAALPIVTTYGDDTSDTGLGQLRLGARKHLTRGQTPWTLGLETALPVPYTMGTRVWGSTSRETLPAVEMLGISEVTLLSHGSPLTVRVGVGWYKGPFGFGEEGLDLVYDLGITKIKPLWKSLIGVFELEHLKDHTPWSLRGLLRTPIGPSHFDLGLQIPVAEYLSDPTSIQLIAAWRSH